MTKITISCQHHSVTTGKKVFRRYLDGQKHNEPHLMSAGALEQMLIQMWNQTCNTHYRLHVFTIYTIIQNITSELREIF